MAGFYATHIFPRLMDWAMGTKRFQRLRQESLADLYGTVLEIGFGTGLNLPHFPPAVRSLTALDPATMLPRSVARRMAKAPMPVAVAHVSAETQPFEDGQFDCVVSTWTLCTIPDPVAALRETRRVLKRGGHYVFLEHGRSDDPRVARWQDRLDPIQQRVACGCHLNRRIDALIVQAGLKIERFERFSLPMVPRLVGEMYRGTSTVPS